VTVIGSKGDHLHPRAALQSSVGVVSHLPSSPRGTSKQVAAALKVSCALRPCWSGWVAELGWSRAKLSVDDGSGSCSCSRGHRSWVPFRVLLASEVLLGLVARSPAGVLSAAAALGRVSHFYSETFFGWARSPGELFL
jgi:hypothetical protein